MMRPERTSWPRVGWQYWGAAACTAAIVLVCTLNSLRWIDRPFPGFFLWENLFVPAVGDPNWTGYRAGIPYQSRLIAMNGRPVTSAAEVYRATANLPVGSAVEYTFASTAEAPRVTLTIPTMRFMVAEYLWTLGNYLAVGALLTLLGFSVYLLRPSAPAARAMWSGGTAWGLYLVTSADIFGPGWFRPLFLLLQAVGPVTLVHVALTFPVERQILRRYPRLLPALYATALVLGLANILLFARSVTIVLVIDRLIPVTGLLLVGLLAQAFRHPPSAAARQRLKIAALGAGAAFFVPIVGFSLFYFGGINFPLNFVTMPMALFPAAIGYAIVKHDLFEVDAIIRRTVAWAILTALIAACYLGGAGLLDLVFAGRGGRGVQLLFLLTLVAVFNPLRNRVQAAVDFLFARDRYDYRRTVTQASQALVSLLDVEAIVARILRTITDTIHVDFGAVWLRLDGAGYDLQAVAGARAATMLPQRLDRSSPLVTRLEAEPQRVLTDESGERDTAIASELSRLRATLVVPMAFEQRLAGFVALGGKESGAFYSREDLELVRTLANQGAVALQNARSYHALAQANDDLLAAQARLIQAERFAAIGEVSAAVAHGIRNPLAGIKAAAQFANMELPAGHPLRENIADVIGEADKLEARIKALLDFAKPFEPRHAPCRLQDIVAAALASLRSQIGANGIAVADHVDAALPDAQLDPAQIEELMLVLLSNAIEAMPAGGTLTVTAALTLDGQRLRVEVGDTGRGISPEQMPRLFKLFATTKPTGTGIGLAVAKKIVERHGGSISAESTPGQGCRFIVELPLTPGGTT